MNIVFKRWNYLILCLFCFLANGMVFSQQRNIVLLDKDWKFMNGESLNAEKGNFDDQSWETVKVPHDWAIKGQFDMTLDAFAVKVIEDGDKVAKMRTGRTGALPIFGIGWYRKILPVFAEDKDKRVFIEFDGAMSNAKIYLNGNFVGEWPYGYSSFSFEITNSIRFGKENLLAVRLENKPESARWYTGAGIYRNVRLVKTSSFFVDHWGTFVTTPAVNSKIAEISIKTQVVANQTDDATLELVTDIFSKNGTKVGSVSTKQIGHGEILFNQNVKIKNPQLWSVEAPNLYYALSKVYVNKIQTDEYKTVFGCRSIRYDKDKGFFLNEKSVKIKGVCMHHDLGPIGSAVNRRATERQLQMMKDMGANAIRTSHNPPSQELLELCDSLGLLVQVESFDQWRNGKNKNGYSTLFDKWAEKDIQNMIRRDRNHPSIIMWSIGNEVREQNMAEGREIANILATACRKEDSTRPVTAAFNNHNAAIKNGLADQVDLVGFNYKPTDYKAKHKQYPNYIIYGSETSSTVSSRGEYKFPVKENKDAWYNDYQVSSYDMEYPGWAYTPDTEFAMQDDNEFVLGEFVWTGFDYLGEPTPYNEMTPARSSYFGIVDLAGLKKDRFYLYQSKWSTLPVLHLLPHWNWSERIGQNVPVFCYTNYPKAELFVNGKSMGVKQKNNSNKYTRYRLMWNDVIYQPGEIKVIAYDKNDMVIAQEVIKTAGEPYAIKLTADRSIINVGSKDLSFVTIEVVDKDGNLCPRADNLLFFEVKGAGKLKALCNGSSIDQTSFGSNYMKLFNGKMVAVIESGDSTGITEITTNGGLLKQGICSISVVNQK